VTPDLFRIVNLLTAVVNRHHLSGADALEVFALFSARLLAHAPRERRDDYLEVYRGSIARHLDLLPPPPLPDETESRVRQ
jgi:hypothetical protein